MLNTIYKKTKNGAVQFWRISVKGNRIITRFGQVGTTSPQKDVEIIESGKNIGRANETTPEQQALAEAQARHTKKLDREAYTLDESGIKIGGPPVPMLAHTYEKHGHKLQFPCYANPKLDGSRCVAVKGSDGKVTLYSRKGTIFTSVPHINRALEDGPDFCWLDTELYSHQYKDNFEHIIHLIKQQVPCEGHDEVELHVFDVIRDEPYRDRLKWLRQWFRLRDEQVDRASQSIQMVEAIKIKDRDQIEEAYDRYADQGYEGVMLRSATHHYEHSRSYGLLKHKKFIDGEFEIIDVKRGRGRMKKHGVFVCLAISGNKFSAKMEGRLGALKKILRNKDQYIGKMVTVRYQGISKKKSVPRFPVAVRLHPGV